MAEDDTMHSLFDYVFNVKPTDVENLVPQNSLQQKILDRVRGGGKIWLGCGVLK